MHSLGDCRPNYIGAAGLGQTIFLHYTGLLFGHDKGFQACRGLQWALIKKPQLP
jgi:hypothetical protein